MKKHSRWWMILIAVIVLLFLFSAAFLPAWKVYLAPKTVLAAALTDTYGALSQRMQHSPVILIGKTLDFENGNTVDLKLENKNDILGTILYDMEVQMKWNPKQIASRGTVTSQGKAMDLSVYLDGNFAALSSAGLLQGNYYGLTYDTFGQDIRANSLLSFALGEKTLTEWEQIVGNLQDMMSDPIAIPSFQKEDLKAILGGIMALSAEVDRDVQMPDGIAKNCYVISFEATGTQIQAGLDYLNATLPVSFEPDDDLEISFWLLDGWVYRIEADTEDMELVLTFGTEDLGLRYEYAGKTRSIMVHTQQSGNIYQERIQLTGEKSADISYSWNLSGGDLMIDVNREGERYSHSAKLNPTEDGFCLETTNFEGLMHLLLETKDTGDSPCVLNISKGASIVTPSYKNFSQWSLEDLLTLLTGIGGVLGFHFA